MTHIGTFDSVKFTKTQPFSSLPETVQPDNLTETIDPICKNKLETLSHLLQKSPADVTKTIVLDVLSSIQSCTEHFRKPLYIQFLTKDLINNVNDEIWHELSNFLYEHVNDLDVDEEIFNLISEKEGPHIFKKIKESDSLIQVLALPKSYENQLIVEKTIEKIHALYSIMSDQQTQPPTSLEIPSIEQQDEISQALREDPSLVIREEIATIGDKKVEVIARKDSDSSIPRITTIFTEMNPSISGGYKYIYKTYLTPSATTPMYASATPRDELMTKAELSSAMKNFQKEAQISQHLSQKTPYITKYFLVRHTKNLKLQNQYGILTNFHNNGDFFTYFRKIKDEKKIVNALIQFATALQAMHDAGYIHSDIKPENTLIDNHENLLLADFGATKEIKPNAQSLLSTTPGYCAPELLAHDLCPLSTSIDIWSFGILLARCWDQGLLEGEFQMQQQLQVFYHVIYRENRNLECLKSVLTTHKELASIFSFHIDSYDITKCDGRERLLKDIASTLEEKKLPTFLNYRCPLIDLENSNSPKKGNLDLHDYKNMENFLEIKNYVSGFYKSNLISSDLATKFDINNFSSLDSRRELVLLLKEELESNEVLDFYSLLNDIVNGEKMFKAFIDNQPKNQKFTERSFESLDSRMDIVKKEWLEYFDTKIRKTLEKAPPRSLGKLALDLLQEDPKRRPKSLDATIKGLSDVTEASIPEAFIYGTAPFSSSSP